MKSVERSKPYNPGFNLTIDEKYHKRFEACYWDNLHSIRAGQELYHKGNSKEEFYKILEKNMHPVYDSARRQGYEVWNIPAATTGGVK